jgi:hypothetical protein
MYFPGHVTHLSSFTVTCDYVLNISGSRLGLLSCHMHIFRTALKMYLFVCNMKLSGHCTYSRLFCVDGIVDESITLFGISRH